VLRDRGVDRVRYSNARLGIAKDLEHLLHEQRVALGGFMHAAGSHHGASDGAEPLGHIVLSEWRARKAQQQEGGHVGRMQIVEDEETRCGGGRAGDRGGDVRVALEARLLGVRRCGALGKPGRNRCPRQRGEPLLQTQRTNDLRPRPECGAPPASQQRPYATRMSRAAAAALSSSAMRVFPIPGSPTMCRRPPRPSRARSNWATARAISALRPTNGRGGILSGTSVPQTMLRARVVSWSAMDGDERRALEDTIRRLMDAGEPGAAMTAAIQGYGPELFRFLAAQARDHDYASDVFGAVCEMLWKYLPTFRWDSSFRVWAYTIARCEFIRTLRDIKRERRQVPIADIQSMEDAIDQVRSSTTAHLRSEVKDGFARLRAELDPDDEILLVLRVDRDLEWKEIARILGSKSATLTRDAAAVRKRFERIKNRLRERAESEMLDLRRVRS